MFLQRIEIKNFRGIKNLILDLEETTILIGENNTGKSSILDALQFCLSRSLTRKSGVFQEYDHHLNDTDSQPADAEPIEIILFFVERKEDEWPDTIIQILDKAIQINSEGLQEIILKVTSGYSETVSDFVSSWDFLDIKGNPLTNAKAPRNIIQLQQLAPVFYLAAMRDSAQEFRPRSQFWGPFVRSLKIDPAEREKFEKNLSELNQKILDTHKSLETVKDRLSNTSKLVPLETKNPVNIEAIPNKIFDLLSRTQVTLTSKSGARLPINRHGEGTQSLAVICLFDAFLQSRLADSYQENTEPILALEEPEAHLHPSAIRSVVQMLQEFKGQKIIATHSGDLVSGVPLTSLRRLRRIDGEISVYQIQDGSLLEDDIHKLDYHVRTTRGNLLFARCWLLVEGETDHLIFNECARILGYDLFSEGVCCVGYAQANAEQFIKLADQLGIEWMVIADNDQDGEKYIKSAKSFLDGRKEEKHLHILDHGNMEVFLSMEGYGAGFENNISDQKKDTITAEKGTVEYWTQVIKSKKRDFSKPRAAILILEEMEKKGDEGVPKLLQKIIEYSIDLSREAR